MRLCLSIYARHPHSTQTRGPINIDRWSLPPPAIQHASQMSAIETAALDCTAWLGFSPSTRHTKRQHHAVRAITHEPDRKLFDLFARRSAWRWRRRRRRGSATVPLFICGVRSCQRRTRGRLCLQNNWAGLLAYLREHRSCMWSDLNAMLVHQTRQHDRPVHTVLHKHDCQWDLHCYARTAYFGRCSMAWLQR